MNLLASGLLYVMLLLRNFSSVCWTMVPASGNVLTVAGSPVNGEASSPPPAINDNRPSGDNLDTILFQLRQVTRERDELRKRLALASPGTTFDDCRCKSCPCCQVVVVVTVISLLVTLFNLADVYKSVYCNYTCFLYSQIKRIRPDCWLWPMIRCSESSKVYDWFILSRLLKSWRLCPQFWLPCFHLLCCLG